VVTALSSEIDFSRDSIPLGKFKQLHEIDFPYLEITEQGRSELYGSKPVIEKVEIADKHHRLKKSWINSSLS